MSQDHSKDAPTPMPLTRPLSRQQRRAAERKLRKDAAQVQKVWETLKKRPTDPTPEELRLAQQSVRHILGRLSS